MLPGRRERATTDLRYPKVYTSERGRWFKGSKVTTLVFHSRVLIHEPYRARNRVLHSTLPYGQHCYMPVGEVTAVVVGAHRSARLWVMLLSPFLLLPL